MTRPPPRATDRRRPPRFALAHDATVAGVGEIVRVGGAELHHMRDVMRLGAGAEVVLIAGNGAQYAGRITGYGYHGHDAVVTVQPEQDPQAPPLTVRTLGGQALSPGSKVTLRAHGPVIAWPQRSG